MNSFRFNTSLHMGGGSANSIMNNGVNKMQSSMPRQPGSLMSMLLYEGTQSLAPQHPTNRSRPGHFFPIDEYKDLSLREILDITDDLIFDDNDNTDLFGQFPYEPAPPLRQQAPPQPKFTTSHDAQPAQLWPTNTPQQEMEPQSLEPQMTQSTYQQLTTSGLPATRIQTSSTTRCIDLSPKKKRSRRCESHDDDDDDNDDDDDEDGGGDVTMSPPCRFRTYQSGQWSKKFQELCEYRQKNGNCLVPYTHTENLPLARWVKRQRYQFKLMQKGERTTSSSSSSGGGGGCNAAMTPERVQALDEIGFCWDSQGAAWGERLSELKDYCRQFSHCNVPSTYSDNPQLATWIKCQRRQYKLYMEGKASNMTPLRIIELENLGIEWELRSCKKAKRCC